MVSFIRLPIHYTREMVGSRQVFWKDQGVVIHPIPSSMGFILRPPDSCDLLLIGEKGG